MKKIINSAIRHPLISGSTIIFAGSMAASFLSYLFNLVMGRFLTPSDYGALIALVSIFNVFSVLSTTVNTVFSKFTASFVGQEKKELIGPLFINGSLWVGGIALVVCIAFAFFSAQIADFLNIKDSTLLVITSFSLFFSYLSFVGYGVLQGLLKFGYFSFINIISSLSKLIFALFLYYLGFGLLGAVISIFLSSLIGYFPIFHPLSRFLKKEYRKISIPNLRAKVSKYALPVFLSNIGIIAFITSDVILVKHFFAPAIAGQYAAISIIGRSIFYAVSPIALAMFPLVAQKHERKEDLKGVVALSLFLVGAPSIILSIIYFTFPEIIRTIFFPRGYAIDEYLGPFSIFIIFYVLAYVLNIFYLAIGKIRVSIFTVTAALLQIVLIYAYHKNLNEIINDLTISAFLLLICLLIYFPFATKKGK